MCRWYLEHVYPESQMPLDYFFLGEMRNDASHNCLDTMGRKSGEEVSVPPELVLHPASSLLPVISRHQRYPCPRPLPGLIGRRGDRPLSY